MRLAALSWFSAFEWGDHRIWPLGFGGSNSVVGMSHPIQGLTRGHLRRVGPKPSTNQPVVSVIAEFSDAPISWMREKSLIGN